MGPEQTVEATFDAILIDDVCSFLTPRLVSAVKKSGAEVVGVFSPTDGSDAKRRLLECGISDVIETDAAPEEYLEKVMAALAHRLPVSMETPAPSVGWSIAVTGASDGVGVTEVAVALARGISSKLKVALVDVDPTWPSVAQRLDLPLHPNIRTALDIVAHGSGDLEAASHLLGEMTVVGGVADQGSGSPLAQSEVVMLFDALSESVDVLVADLGPLQHSVRGVLRGFDAIALVGTGDPVGITRLLHSAGRAIEQVPAEAVVLVANKTFPRRYYESEIRRELQSSFPDVPLVVLPFDQRLSASIWEGELSPRGPFARSVGRMASLIIERLEP
jgi:MinD-like ATPase involved in chromosome partitioning or flagellar assembly